jgi:predicted nucleotidyltransferase
MTTPSFRRILEVLREHDVEFVVVGGVAAVLHGAPMTTFDIDTLVKVDEANAERLLRALAVLQARYREHAETIQPTKDDLMAGGHLLLMTNSGPLDVLGFVGHDQRYEDLATAMSTMKVGDLTIQVLSLEKLVELKRELGRDKDHATLKLLEAVLRRRG